MISLSVTVRKDIFFVNFTKNTSPQVDWGVNVVYNFTYAYVFMAVKSAFDPDIPINEEATCPIHMTAPDGAVVNRFSAAVAARMQAGHFHDQDGFKEASAAAVPDHIIADSRTHRLRPISFTENTISFAEEEWIPAIKQMVITARFFPRTGRTLRWKFLRAIRRFCGSKRNCLRFRRSRKDAGRSGQTNGNLNSG